MGVLLLSSNGEALTGLAFEGSKPQGRCDRAPFSQVVEQLDAYFAGRLRHFTCPLQLVGTPFQLKVWQALQSIPYGTTWSYAQLAQAIHQPAATRAVGLANGRNPIAIVVPCHRVIGKDGSLTGFGGGLSRKRFLLDLEQGHR